MIRRLALALSLCAPLAATANPEHCQCLWRGSFSEVAQQTDLVIQGEVTDIKGNAVDFRPLAQYQGETWLHSLRVWMKTGSYCRPETEQFTPGSRWVLALTQIKELPEDGFNPHTPNQSFGRKLDYTLSACGGYWLKMRGQTVVGNLVPGTARWDHEPDMTPVLVDLIEAFLDGRASIEDLEQASREDPALRDLMLDTRSFLRGQDEYLPDKDTDN